VDTIRLSVNGQEGSTMLCLGLVLPIRSNRDEVRVQLLSTEFKATRYLQVARLAQVNGEVQMIRPIFRTPVETGDGCEAPISLPSPKVPSS